MINEDNQEYVNATSKNVNERIAVARQTTNPKIIALLANDDNWYVKDALEKNHPNFKNITKERNYFSNIQKKWKQENRREENNIIINNPIAIDKNLLNEFKNRWMKRAISHERSETSLFWTELFTAIGKDPDDLLFEYKIRKESGAMSSIDVFVPGFLLVEQKSPKKGLDDALSQAKGYYYNIDEEERPRFIIVCNFKNFVIIEVEKQSIASGEIEDDDGNAVWVNAHERIIFRKLTVFSLKNITANIDYLNMLLDEKPGNNNLAGSSSLKIFLTKAGHVLLQFLLISIKAVGYMFAIILILGSSKRVSQKTIKQIFKLL